jgi:hypothetical protein
MLLAGALALMLAAGVALATSGNQESSNGKDTTKEDSATNTDTAKGANSNSDTSSDKGQGLNFVDKGATIVRFVDVGDPGPSPGDIYVFSDNLFDSQDSSNQVGQSDGRCNLIDPATGHFECTTVSTFADGTITTDGILVNKQGTKSVASVTGGTGAYRGVSGEGSVVLGPPGGPHQVQFILLKK